MGEKGPTPEEIMLWLSALPQLYILPSASSVPSRLALSDVSAARPKSWASNAPECAPSARYVTSIPWSIWLLTCVLWRKPVPLIKDFY